MAVLSRLAEDTSPRSRARWWASVPFSVLCHGLVLAVALVAPLAATGALPTPASVFAFSMALPPPPPPEPDPLRLARAAAPSVTPPLVASAVVSSDPVPPVVTPGPPAADRLTVPGSLPADLLGDAPLLAVPPPIGPVRPGGLVRIPIKLVDVPPVYPAIARQAHVSGTVLVEALIGTDGRVTDAHVLKSAPLLDQAALAAVRQWRYTTTTVNGVPVAVVLTVTVTFVLR